MSMKYCGYVLKVSPRAGSGFMERHNKIVKFMKAEGMTALGNDKYGTEDREKSLAVCKSLEQEDWFKDNGLSFVWTNNTIKNTGGYTIKIHPSKGHKNTELMFELMKFMEKSGAVALTGFDYRTETHDSLRKICGLLEKQDGYKSGQYVYSFVNNTAKNYKGYIIKLSPVKSSYDPKFMRKLRDFMEKSGLETLGSFKFGTNDLAIGWDAHILLGDQDWFSANKCSYEWINRSGKEVIIDPKTGKPREA